MSDVDWSIVNDRLQRCGLPIWTADGIREEKYWSDRQRAFGNIVGLVLLQVPGSYMSGLASLTTADHRLLFRAYPCQKDQDTVACFNVLDAVAISTFGGPGLIPADHAAVLPMLHHVRYEGVACGNKRRFRNMLQYFTAIQCHVF